MKDQTLGAIAAGFLAAGAVGAAWTLHKVTSSDYYCPGPSAAVVVPLLGPCQVFNAVVARDASGDETVRIALPALRISPARPEPPGTQLAEK